MTQLPSVERIRRAWQARASGAREQALVAVLLVVVVGSAHLARLGTSWARIAAASAILAIVAWQIGLVVARRRENASARLTVQRVFRSTDPALGDRALRALTLLEREQKEDPAFSGELAGLHFSRLLDRLSTDSVGVAASRYAQRYRALAIGLVCLASVAVLVGPMRVIEGLDVLFARHGRAPLPMSWLAYGRLFAQPPAYTREPERALSFGVGVALPKGTVVTLRGEPRVAGRKLVVTDGAHEEPFVDDGAGGAVARYVVRGNATVRVAARFGDVRIDDDDAIEIEMVPDAAPVVEVEGAPKQLRLAEMDRMEVKWVARDDHGIRQVDLVLRSGVREERRVLGRFDGETKVERGGHVVTARDAFLRRMFLPVAITVEARDNDPLDGPKWSHSEPIVVLPPDVGQPESERFVAMTGVRDSLVDLLKWTASVRDTSPEARVRQTKERLERLTTDVQSALSSTYSGATVPRGLRAFIEGQLERLRRKRELPETSVEDAVLALDVTLSALGNRDAGEVSKRLGDVAEEVALAARFARETSHRKEGAERLQIALTTLDKGVLRLETLAMLGRDLGGVARGDAARIRRARDASDLTHAELAALHLAARLRRPTPSFGATTGGHGGKGGGVESGQGQGGGGDGDTPPPSNADEEFDRAANAVAELAQEHENAVRGVESALDEARRADASDALRNEAKRLADRVRDAAEPLPMPGQEFGSPRATAALGREHAKAAAHALDDLDLKGAAESAENALGTLDQAERRLDSDDSLRQHFADARKALQDAKDFAERELAHQRAEAEAKAKGALEQAGDTERDLAERATKLGENPAGQSGKAESDFELPKDTAERLGRAGSVMREAAKELAAGHGERALEMQREAQRLLDQSRLGRSSDSDDGEDESSRRARADERGSERPDSGERHGERNGAIAVGGEVPGPDERARAEEFRRRVLEGLGKERSERLSPAVRRYAEGLLR